MPNPTLRPMRPADLPAILEIWLQANLEAHAFLPAAYWEGQLPLVRRLIPQADVTVAEADGAILAFLGLSAGYIAGLFVRRESRGAGIGAALLAAAKARHAALTLSVYAENTAAVRFYEREGFVRTETDIDPQTQAAEYTMRWERADGNEPPFR